MTQKKITIINYGMGNLGSIKNMLSFLGHDSIISNKKKDIDNSDFLILPGIGKFDHAIDNIDKLNLEEVIKKIFKKCFG